MDYMCRERNETKFWIKKMYVSLSNGICRMLINRLPIHRKYCMLVTLNYNALSKKLDLYRVVYLHITSRKETFRNCIACFIFRDVYYR